MMRVIILTCLFSVVTAATVCAQSSDKTVECKVEPNKNFNYTIIQQGRSIGESPVFSLRVVIRDNKKYNRTDMLKFAENIKARFCNEENISVVIFDDKKALDENSRAVTDYLLYQTIAPGLRGFYSFNRKTGYEGIQFSTKRENPLDEVKIEISKSNKQ